jgi:hypothetical protein
MASQEGSKAPNVCKSFMKSAKLSSGRAGAELLTLDVAEKNTELAFGGTGCRERSIQRETIPRLLGI